MYTYVHNTYTDLEMRSILALLLFSLLLLIQKHHNKMMMSVTIIKNSTIPTTTPTITGVLSSSSLGSIVEEIFCILNFQFTACTVS